MNTLKLIPKIIFSLFCVVTYAQDNLLEYDWLIGNGPSAGFNKEGWFQNGTDQENIRETGTDPHGNTSVIWKAQPDFINSGVNPDGGWSTLFFDIHHENTYRLSVWIKKTIATSGQTIFGMSSRNISHQYTNLELDGAPKPNSLFWTGQLPESNKWYLLVAYVYASDYSGTLSNTETGGVYDPETGQKVVSFPITYKFAPDAIIMTHRAWFNGATDASDSQFFWAPTVYNASMPMPSIQDILYNNALNGQGLWSSSISSNNIYFETGNVGIGTEDPGTDWKLAVNGKIRSKEIKVETGWADYVFEEDYPLPTLQEVEKHIAEKGHLINIPSAEEVEANGIELGEMNKLLLEKIEELTLYILKQEEELKKLPELEERLKKLEGKLK